jgi:hypothetical protein
MTIILFILRLLFRGCITPHIDPVEAWQAVRCPVNAITEEVQKMGDSYWQD